MMNSDFEEFLILLLCIINIIIFLNLYSFMDGNKSRLNLRARNTSTALSWLAHTSRQRPSLALTRLPPGAKRPVIYI